MCPIYGPWPCETAPPGTGAACLCDFLCDNYYLRRQAAEIDSYQLPGGSQLATLEAGAALLADASARSWAEALDDRPGILRRRGGVLRILLYCLRDRRTRS